MRGAPDHGLTVPPERIARLREAFAARFGRPPGWLAAAPGRVNLIGEHVDYNDGLVLPVAIDRWVLAAAAPRDDGLTRVASLDYDEAVEIPLDRLERPAVPAWHAYVAGVAWSLSTAGHHLPGADLAIHGDVPQGAGLSSSAALEVAVAGALLAASGLGLPPAGIARLARRAENDFVGVACGIMDQLAATLGRAGHALLIDCRTGRTDFVPLDLATAGLAIVVADTGVPRTLAGSAYNRRRRECARAAAWLRTRLGPRVASLRDVTPADLAAAAGEMPEPLRRRARHVVSGIDRVRRAARALRRGDLPALGRLMRASHLSLRDDYQVSCPELDRLAELAWAQPGVVGARMTGAGFGGCTVNLVRVDALDAFQHEVVGRYVRETGRPSRMLVCRAVDGLAVTQLDI